MTRPARELAGLVCIRHHLVPGLTQGSSLDGVSCVAASNCVAVGWVGSQDVRGPLAEHWAGGRWMVLSVPNPDPNGGAEFNSVSCVSPAETVR